MTNGLTVLYVEDDRMSRTVMSLLLKKQPQINTTYFV